MLGENKQAIKRFVDYFAATSTSQRSAAQYESLLKKFFEKLEKSYKRVTVDDVSSYINATSASLKQRSHEQSWEVERSSTSAPYRAHFITVLARFYKHAGNNEFYDKLREMRPRLGERHSREPVQLTEEQKRKLIQSDISSNTLINARNRMICATFYGTGIRVSELTALKVSDFEFEHEFSGKSKIIKIIGKGDKERSLPVPRWLWAALKKFVEEFNSGSSEHVFFSERSRKKLAAMTVWKIVKTKALKAGVVVGGKGTHPHQLRSTYATDLEDLGWDLLYRMAALGHANPSTTKMYTKIKEEKLKNLPTTKEVK